MNKRLEKRQLGQTDLWVSRLCFGSLPLGPLQQNLDPRDGGEVILAAFEAGVNFIDTAELYGTYPHIRWALEHFSGDVVVASKSYAYSREGMAQSLEQARRELNRDVIELFLLHEQESRLTLKGHAEALEFLLEAKARGLVKGVGVSTHTVEVTEAAAQMPEIDVIHPIINFRGLGITDGADRNGTGLGPRSPRGKGYLCHEALRWWQFN